MDIPILPYANRQDDVGERYQLRWVLGITLHYLSVERQVCWPRDGQQKVWWPARYTAAVAWRSKWRVERRRIRNDFYDFDSVTWFCGYVYFDFTW